MLGPLPGWGVSPVLVGMVLGVAPPRGLGVGISSYDWPPKVAKPFFFLTNFK